MFPVRDYNIILSVNDEFSQQPLKVKAGDTKSSVIYIQLLDEFIPIDITGLTVKFLVSKPDNTIVWQTPEVVDALQGKIKVELLNQTIAVAGLSTAEVSIQGTNGEKLTFFEFGIEVSDTIDPTDAIVSQNQLPVIDELVADNHIHHNRTFLDKLPDNKGITAGYVLKTDNNEQLYWDEDVIGESGSFVSDSEVNGNIVVDGKEVVVYEHPVQHTPAEIASDTNNQFVSAAEKTVWSSKAEADHNHDSAYAPMLHSHDDRYYTENEVETKLSGKAEKAHSHNVLDVTGLQSTLDSKASTSHNHDTMYSKFEHTHTEYSPTSHNHDDRYYTETEVDTKVASKADMEHAHTGYAASTHNHDDIYYTETEVDTKLSSKSNTDHNHSGVYEPVITKNSAFNKNFGTVSGTISEGSHNHDAVYATIATLGNAFTGDNIRGTKTITEINGILKSGFYYSVATTQNPIADNGFMFHINAGASDTYATQLFTHAFSDKMWFRRKMAGTWQSWVQLSNGTLASPVKILYHNFVVTTAMSDTISIPLSYDTTRDNINLYINGIKKIKDRHFTTTNNIITLINFTFNVDDEVEIEIFRNTL